MKWIQDIYKTCIGYLSRHAGLAFLLSHGGLHLLALILLSVAAFLLYRETSKNETVNVKHLQVGVESISTCPYPGPMCYYIGHINGIFDLYNSPNESDTLDLDLVLVRGDSITKEDFFQEDSSFFEYDVENFVYVKSKDCNINNATVLKKGNTGTLIRDNPKEITYIEQLPAFKDSIIYWHIPIKYAIEKKKNKEDSPTSILYFELFSATPYEFGDYNLSDFLIVDSMFYYDSFFRIQLGNIDIDNDKNEYRPFEIKYIYPEPDIVTPSYVLYDTNKSVERLLKNNGVYLIYEDTMARTKANRISLQYTVLIGAIIAFMLDIIVNLILKWRRLAKTKYHNSTTLQRSKTRLRKKRF